MKKLILILVIILPSICSFAQVKPRQSFVDSLFLRTLKEDGLHPNAMWIGKSICPESLKCDSSVEFHIIYSCASVIFFSDTISTLSATSGIEAGTIQWMPAIFACHFANDIIYRIDQTDAKTGKTIIHLHRSQLHWRNDTTAVVMPYKKPKRKRKGDIYIFGNSSGINGTTLESKPKSKLYPIFNHSKIPRSSGFTSHYSFDKVRFNYNDKDYKRQYDSVVDVAIKNGWLIKKSKNK